MSDYISNCHDCISSSTLVEKLCVFSKYNVQVGWYERNITVNAK